jgi:hypothetical protein
MVVDSTSGETFEFGDVAHVQVAAAFAHERGQNLGTGRRPKSGTKGLCPAYESEVTNDSTFEDGKCLLPIRHFHSQARV